jgi:hypothetical protein
MRVFICGLLFSSLALAQGVENFSGTFLRNSANNAVDNQTSSWAAVADPILLEVDQSPDSLQLSATQHGATATIHYRLDGVESTNTNLWGMPSTDRVKFKDHDLLIESSIQPAGSHLPPAAHGLHVKEIWRLSPDAQTLTIERSYEFQDASYFNFNEKETYLRQTPLSAAGAKTEAAGTNKCNASILASYVKVADAPKAYKGGVTYEHGAALGEAIFQQLGRCVSFDADLSSPFFDGLVRIDKQDHVEFQKNGSTISDSYPDSVVLEVEPVVRKCPPWETKFGLFGMSTQSAIPQEFLNLRFHLRWTGSETRDLPNLPSELLTEPWTELRPPEKFYRLTVPTKGVRLTDTLEIQILSDSGEQIACISGHI